MRLNVPPGTPSPVLDLVKQLNTGKADKDPQAPVAVMAAKFAELPRAVDYPNSLIFVKDRNQLALSDGTNWFPITLGTHY